MVTTTTGTFHWGPERPSFANGAVLYLTERDCSVVEGWCRTNLLQLQSKHAVVSAEYLRLYGTPMRDCARHVPHNKRFAAKRANTINELSWFEAPQYVEQIMRPLDIERTGYLSFEGSEWVLQRPAVKDERKTWAYKRQRYRMESWAGSYLTISMRF